MRSNNGSPVTKWNDPVSPDKKYFYRISAIDETGLESVPSDLQSTE